MHDESAREERVAFLTMALLAEGALLLFAFFAGWLLGHPATTNLTLSFESVGLGVIATLPLLLLLAFIYRSRSRRLIQFRELIRKLLGKPLAMCGWLDLCAIAIAAGVSEEFLFRGVLEPWLSGWGSVFGLIACNLLFGLCHSLTPTYFVFATLMGVYLSMTLRWTEEPNLVVPVCCHTLYDLVAFVVVRRSYLEIDTQNRPDDDGPTRAKDPPSFPVDPVGQ